MSKYDYLEIKDFADETDLLEELLKNVDCLGNDENLLFFAKCDLAEYIIRSFISLSKYSFGSIDLDCEFGDYEDEYIITITGNKEIWCEPARRNGEIFTYSMSDTDIAYTYQEDIGQDMLEELLAEGCYTVLFGIDEESAVDSSDELNDDNNMHGFSISNTVKDIYSSYSFYSTDTDLVKEEYQRFKNRN